MYLPYGLDQVTDSDREYCSADTRTEGNKTEGDAFFLFEPMWDDSKGRVEDDTASQLKKNRISTVRACVYCNVR